MVSKCLFFFSVYIFTASNFALAQNKSQQRLDSLSGALITSLRMQERERAHLVTDKDVYATGENIWFRAFLLNSVSQKISTKSKYLFVDLVDEKDSVISFKILDARNQQLSSTISIPLAASSGSYWLRGYTTHMTKVDSNLIGIKPIYILNDQGEIKRDKPKSSTAKDTIPVISFYPEGGSMMTGANSVVALQATMNDQPLQVDGFIKDDRDATLGHFKTSLLGLGKFEFEPAGRRKYRAVVEWNGKDINYPLPPFNFFGGQLSVTKLPNAYKLRVLIEDSIFRAGMETYVIGISKDSLFFAGIGRGLYEVMVEDKKIPEGIATFYLFNDHMKLFSERSIYVREKSLQTELQIGKPVYNKLEKVTADLKIHGVDGQRVSSIVAISVADSLLAGQDDGCFISFPSQEKIDNFFLAGSQCFSENQIDQLMLLKNNTFQSISGGAVAEPITNNDSLMFIRGIVFNNKNEPLSGHPLTLLTKTTNPIVDLDTSDSNGHFTFPLDNYPDSMQFSIQTGSSRGGRNEIRIRLEPFPYPKFNTPSGLKQPLPSLPADVRKRLRAYREVSDESRILPPVNVVKKEDVSDYDVSKRVNRNSVILTAKDLDERYMVGNTILGVGGVHVLNGMLVIGGLTGMRAPDQTSEPLLLVDGSQVSVTGSSQIGQSSPLLGYLNSINPKDIEFIEILKGPEAANFGVRGGNGVILVNMRSTRSDLPTTGNNLQALSAKGIRASPLFPSIIHDGGNKSLHENDRRSVLFWDGSYLANGNESFITFYTSNVASVYSVTITGITISGDFVRKQIHFRTL